MIRYDTSLQVPLNYEQTFHQAVLTFAHQSVFCPIRREMVPLHPYPEDKTAQDFEFAGPSVSIDLVDSICLCRFMDRETVTKIAQCEVDPFTLEPFVDTTPECPNTIPQEHSEPSSPAPLSSPTSEVAGAVGTPLVPVKRQVQITAFFGVYRLFAITRDFLQLERHLKAQVHLLKSLSMRLDKWFPIQPSVAPSRSLFNLLWQWSSSPKPTTISLLDDDLMPSPSTPSSSSDDDLGARVRLCPSKRPGLPRPCCDGRMGKALVSDGKRLRSQLVQQRSVTRTLSRFFWRGKPPPQTDDETDNEDQPKGENAEETPLVCLIHPLLETLTFEIGGPSFRNCRQRLASV